MSMEPAELARNLLHFTGSETWYRHQFVRRITYTDGVKYLADQAGAYWLLDEIILAQVDSARPAIKAEEFQGWKLVVDQTKHTAVLTCDDGNGNIVYTKSLKFTDFPLPEIELWFANEVLYLPSEH